LKIAGLEGGLEDGVFRGRARVFDGERQLIDALERDADSFADRDMVVIRYEGPRGAPGMPELLDPTSRITALCRQRHITIALMTTRASRAVGRARDRPRRAEAALGGPIAVIEDGDSLVIDVNADRMDCLELDDESESARRAAAWQAAANANGGVHPSVTPVASRMLRRMRASARPALLGAGITTDH